MRGRAFPSGLVARVVAHLELLGVERVVVDDPAPACQEPAGELLGVELRPYQVEAVEVALRRRLVTLECPTGGGKTEIGAEIIRRVGGPALWLTHLKDLAAQSRTRLAARLGRSVGLYGSGKRDLDVVTVGMVQTIARAVKTKDAAALEFLASVRLVVFDEAHHGGADTWALVAGACAGAAYRVGLSGTVPKRDALTDLKLEGVCGPTHVVVDVGTLATAGFLAAPTVRLIEPPASSYATYAEVRDEVLPTWRRDARPLQRLGTKLFHVARRRSIVENEARHRAFAEAAARHYRAGERVLVLCELVDHARAIEAALRRAGAERTWCVTGEDRDRDETLCRFRSLDPPAVLVATPWFREGMDVPEVDVGFLAGANLSEIAVLQGFGRMLRPRADKQTVLVYAALDGRDPGDEKDYFAQHTAAQLRMFRERGWSVQRQAEWMEEKSG